MKKTTERTLPDVTTHSGWIFQDDADEERLALVNAITPAMSDSEICQIAVEFAAERQHAAIEQARYWLRVSAPGRALEVLESAL